jgi:Leucine-rich repeat (LRR) protein
MNEDIIVDLSPLAPLTQLTLLEAGGNSINNIDALATLVELVQLNLYGNSIQDITALSNMTQLVSLSLGGNQIEDISPLTHLNALDYLELDSNIVKDIQPLVLNTGLVTLNDFINLDFNCLDLSTGSVQQGMLDELQNPPRSVLVSATARRSGDPFCDP